MILKPDKHELYILSEKWTIRDQCYKKDDTVI